ncbi:MAG: hypothetical protein JXB85_11105 [Anaerolineales bacterium]|nr:hypothetical protein [Anaerolineales bacterium]
MRVIIFVPFLFLLAACAPPATAPSAPAATEAAVPTSFEAATVPPTVAEVAARQWTSGDMTFTLESPVDGAIVSEPQVFLTGTTNVETVLSVNDELYVLPGGQPFSVPAPLFEGPNALSIVVSDANGDLVEFVLTVIYQP